MEALNRRYTFRANEFRSDFEIDRFAAFGQTETFFGGSNTLTLGLRFERHDANYRDGDGVAFEPTDHLWGGRIAVDRMLGADTMIYASLARGYKAGGFNADGSLPSDLRQYDPESLYNFELGVKGSWSDDRLVARAALFHMWRDDMQVATSIVRVRPDGSSEFIEFTGNASSGRNYGVEVEFEWQATDRLAAFGSVGLLESEYENFTNVAGRSLDGRAQTHAPRYQAYVGAQYAVVDGFYVRAELEAKDSFYFSDSNDESSSAYELVHVSAGYEAQRWSVDLWARNVTDVDYEVRGYYFGNDPRLDYAARGYTQLGEPRRVGATLQWKLAGPG
ncbi:MAG: TonB-dependent receptor [Gammaproteobacteria bacterium]|nr:TonB-dependent receptor [Gammaproteobacteria bacterium]